MYIRQACKLKNAFKIIVKYYVDLNEQIYIYIYKTLYMSIGIKHFTEWMEVKNNLTCNYTKVVHFEKSMTTM